MPGSTEMTFATLMQALQIADPPARWAEGWEAARRAGDADPLSDAALAEIARVCRFPDDVEEPLFAAVAHVRAHPALAGLLRIWHALLFDAEDRAEAGYAEWPLPNVLMVDAALFPAVVIFSGFPRLFARHRARQIPEAVTRDTCSDLAVWMRHYRRVHGQWGFSQLPWLMRHCRGELFRLGRLQFEPIAYPGGLRAFRHAANGTVLSLAEAGVRYRRDGLVDGTNDIVDDDAWTSELLVDGTIARGNPIHPLGTACPQVVTLPLSAWCQVLAPGDPVWNLHIPEDGKMDHARCGDALQQAADFFPRYFPEASPARAVITSTWLLEPQLAQILPPESNIVRFQREFYLSPVLSHQREPLWRIFGEVPEDLTRAPRATTLERAVLDYTLAGHRLGCANGFILCDEPAWGTQRYQQQAAQIEEIIAGNMPA